MAEYSNENRGAIWGNDKKEKDTHPDFTGSLNVDGTEYWVSAWKRKPDAGPKAPALSFSVKPKEERTERERSGSAYGNRSGGGANQARGGDPSDEIPFAPIRGLV
ncbi:MAG TPA: hypothetical protein VIN36_07785 [Thiobacillus sp.]